MKVIRRDHSAGSVEQFPNNSEIGVERVLRPGFVFRNYDELLIMRKILQLIKKSVNLCFISQK